MSFFSNTWINGASSQVDVVGGGKAPSGGPFTNPITYWYADTDTGTGGTKPVGSLGITGDVSQGGAVTISSISGFSFGDDGPILSYRLPADTMVDGNPIPATNIGAASVSPSSNGYPIAEDMASMPRGKAVKMGTDDSVVNSTNYRFVRSIDATPSLEYFEHYYYQFPLANQTAAAPLLDGAATWQQKIAWAANETDGYTSTDKSDGFNGVSIWSAGGLTWTGGNAFATNMTGQTIQGNGAGMRDPVDLDKQRSSPLCRQMWVKCNPALGGLADAGFSRSIDSSDGSRVETSFAGNNVGGTAVTGYDRWTLPGYVSGFNIPSGAHSLISDSYRTTGTGVNGRGAAARVEIHDSETLASSIAIMTVTSWADKEIQLIVDEGIFHQLPSLAGLWWAIYDADNNLIAKEQVSV